MRYKNVWSQDGKIYAKRHDDRIITTTYEREFYLIDGRVGPRHFKHYYQSYYKLQVCKNTGLFGALRELGGLVTSTFDIGTDSPGNRAYINTVVLL